MIMSTTIMPRMSPSRMPWYCVYLRLRLHVPDITTLPSGQNEVGRFATFCVITTPSPFVDGCEQSQDVWQQQSIPAASSVP